MQPGRFLLQIHYVLQSPFDGASNPLCFTGDGATRQILYFKSNMFYSLFLTALQIHCVLGATAAFQWIRQSGPSHSGEAPRGQSDAQARRIRSIGFLEASRGFKEASKNLQEASWRLQEASKRHPRGFQRLRCNPADFCFKSIMCYSLLLTALQIHCVLRATVQPGRFCTSNPICFIVYF